MKIPDLISSIKRFGSEFENIWKKKSATLRWQFLKSHMGIAAIGAFSLLLALSAFFWIRSSALELVTFSAPNAQMTAQLQSKLQESLAALRGWVSVADPKLVEKRQQAWELGIKPLMTNLLDLSKVKNDQESLKELNEIQAMLRSLENWQWHIEDVAQTPGNRPASRFFEHKIEPLVSSILLYCDILLKDQYSKNEQQSKIKLQSLITELQKYFFESSRHLLLFINNGEEAVVDQFQEFTRKVRLTNLKISDYENVLRPNQKSVFEVLSAEVRAYGLLADEVIRLRRSRLSNVSNYWLAEKAMPRAAEIANRLAEFEKIQSANLEINAKIVERVSNFIPLITGLLALFLGIFTLNFAVWGSKKMALPIVKLVRATEKLSEGTLQEDITVSDDNEIGLLTRSFNTMRKRLQDTQEKQQLAQEQIEKRKKQLEAEAWLKTGQNQLSEILRKEIGFEEIGVLILDLFMDKCSTQMGVIYTIEGDEPKKIASLGVDESYQDQKNNKLLLRALKTNKAVKIENLPEDYPKISSGIGEKIPDQILILPLTSASKVRGLIELAKFGEFTQREYEFLNTVSDTIGISFVNIESRTKILQLLEESNKASVLLTSQKEELEAANSQMHIQTEELRANQEELRQQSEELRASNEELSNKSDDLKNQNAEIEKQKYLIEVASAKLEKKAEQLEISSKYKSEFLANMSHELRTPLNSLLILAKELTKNDEKNLTESQLEDVNIIHDGGRDLMNLINDILDLSKVEAGKLILQIENTSFQKLKDRMHKLFDHVFSAKGLNFDIIIDPNLPKEFSTDPIRLEQILKNLVSNASKFTETGGVTLEMKLGTQKRSEIAQDTVEFLVVDTGIGISEDRQQDIWEAFQQADGSTSRKYGGTGLGLTISRQLTRLLHGEISMTSTAGVGTSFTISHPLELAVEILKRLPNEDPPEKRESLTISNVEPKPIEITPSQPQERKTIPEDEGSYFKKKEKQLLPDDRFDLKEDKKLFLVIEDDLRFAKILMKIIKSRGFQCIVAGDGKHGLELANSHLPAGIILDIGLPILDGLAVLDRLKFNLKTRHIPVHIISAQEESIQSLQKGALGYLEKPADIEKILKVIDNIEKHMNQKLKEILVIEDDVSTQLAIRRIFDQPNIYIEMAESGAEGVRRFEANHYDCVILDLSLEDTTGFEVLQKIRLNPQKNVTPVVVFTGKDITKEEHMRLAEYTESIIIKGADSYERLLDEVTLFLHSTEDSLKHEQKKILDQTHSETEVFKNRKILVVDDDMRNTIALSKVLRKQGLIVTLADNGKTALEKIQADTFDLVLMDVMMPIMDGLEATEKIRLIPENSDLPIISLTAKAMVEDREKCIASGANDYITKPVDQDELLSMIKIWLMRNSRSEGKQVA